MNICDSEFVQISPCLKTWQKLSPSLQKTSFLNSKFQAEQNDTGSSSFTTIVLLLYSILYPRLVLSETWGSVLYSEITVMFCINFKSSAPQFLLAKKKTLPLQNHPHKTNKSNKNPPKKHPLLQENTLCILMQRLDLV